MNERSHPLEVGSVLYTSWGYDQTNVDFYRVDELKGKSMVRLVPVSKKAEGETSVSAAPATVRTWDVHLGLNGQEECQAGKWKRPRPDGSVRMSSYCSAHLDDREKHYETPWYAGH